MKRVVGYCRTSTEGQSGDDKFGIAFQKEAIIEFCKENDMEIVEWFIDEAVSGADEAPPAFSSILNGLITNPPIEAVVVLKSDRVSRNVEKYFGFKYLLRRNKIALISATENFAQMGPMATAYEAISALFAEMEREFIKVRMSGGRNAKSRVGGYAGGKAPYGYKSERGSKVLEICNEEVPLVKRIFYLREREGKSMQAICNILKEEGFKTRKGGDFQISTIQYILGNRKMYEGYYRYGKNKEWVVGQHEPILKEGD